MATSSIAIGAIGVAVMTVQFQWPASFPERRYASFLMPLLVNCLVVASVVLYLLVGNGCRTLTNAYEGEILPNINYS
jgi:hypothetical protein